MPSITLLTVCTKPISSVLSRIARAEMEIYISAIIEDILTDCVGGKAKLSEVAEIVGKLVDPKEEEYQKTPSPFGNTLPAG